MHLHVAVGVGTLELYTVGSAQGGWQYVAAGEPFSASVAHPGLSRSYVQQFHVGAPLKTAVASIEWGGRGACF